MYHKITTANYPVTSDFKLGFGFYLVSIEINKTTELVFFNPIMNVHTFICPVSELPVEFLALFEERGKEEITGFVSEAFALRAIAIAKANIETVKIKEITL